MFTKTLFLDRFLEYKYDDTLGAAKSLANSNMMGRLFLFIAIFLVFSLGVLGDAGQDRRIKLVAR